MLFLHGAYVVYDAAQAQFEATAKAASNFEEVGAVVEAPGFNGGNKRQILNFPRRQLCI